jgi:hypothetical protein
MRARRHNTRRLAQRTRLVVRPRALDEPGFDDLDEWMVGCPAGEPMQPSD